MKHVTRRSLTRRVRTSPWLSPTARSALLVVAIGGAWPTTLGFAQAAAPPAQNEVFEVASVKPHTSVDQGVSMVARPGGRSEERRVGKECQSVCRSRWSPYH